MTDTNQLPEPDLGYIKTDISNQPAFSARQMREAMTHTNKLPPLPTPKFTETIRGVPCITVTEHEHLMRAYALQARAPVQGDPSWWTRETDEGAEWTDTAPLVLSGWTPLYTTPQPAQATQAEVPDGIRPEDFTVDVVVKPMGGFAPVNTQGVRVTHKPTGISVTCDVARSQHTNRHQAFEKLRAILALHSSTAPDLSCKSVQARLATQWGYVRPAAVPMTDAHPMQPIVIAKDGRIRFKKNQIVDDLYELYRVHKLDLNEMARRNYSQEDRNQFAQLIGYSVGGWGTLSYATGVEKADAIAEALAAQAKKETP